MNTERFEYLLYEFRQVGTELSSEPVRTAAGGETLQYFWSVRGDSYEVQFDETTQKVSYRHTLSRKREFERIDLLEFIRTLIYPLREAAKNTAHFLSPIPLKGVTSEKREEMQRERPSAAPAEFVPPLGRRLDTSGPSGDAEKDVAELINEIARESRSQDITKVVLIQAPAGMGKTSFLRRLALDKASTISEQFDQGRLHNVGPLYLYADVRGRRLNEPHVAFNLALSGQEWPQLPPAKLIHLIRAGVVIPVLDGFDELISLKRGQGDFRAFRAFLNEIDGAGLVVVAARTSYVEREMLRQIEESRDDANTWEIERVTLSDWGNREIEQYAEQRGLSKYASKTVEILCGRDSPSLLRTPFFTKCVIEDFKEGNTPQASKRPSSLLTTLMDRLLEREAPKREVQGTQDPLVTPDELRRFYQHAAFWSWLTGDDDGDGPVEPVGDLGKEPGLSEQYVRPILEEIIGSERTEVAVLRIADLPLLELTPDRGRIFTSEMIQDLFLAQRFAALTENTDELSMAFENQVAISEFGARAIVELSPVTAPETAKTFLSASKRSGRDVISRNAAQIVAACMNDSVARVLTDLTLQNIEFADLDSELRNARFEDCVFESVHFQNCDLTGTQFVNCIGEISLSACNTATMTPDQTQFGNDLQVRAESWFDNGSLSYDGNAFANSVLSVMKRAERAEPETFAAPFDDEALEFLRITRRAFSRTIAIYDGNHSPVPFSDSRWQRFERCLLDTGVVEFEDRPHRKLRLRTRAADLEWRPGGSEDPRVSELWTLLARDFPRN